MLYVKFVAFELTWEKFPALHGVHRNVSIIFINIYDNYIPIPFRALSSLNAQSLGRR